uniref:DNA 3'-5' helicase n=1 Tax=viral metagenome TaxID=1070528 RepID=A0A6C0H271_9ZZZZ
MSLNNLIASLNLNIGNKDFMYDNIKCISNYIDVENTLSKLKKGELSNIIEGLKNYLVKENEIVLDTEQINIVESNNYENKRIIAGAGSGKTTTILYRIKYLLDNFITPDRILVLTFNRDSAQNIRNRIKQIFGFDVYIKIYTIDAFCCRLFNKYNINNNIFSLSEYCSMGLKIMQEYGKEISSQFKYIFFDEFQDVNDIQFNILKIFVDNGCFLTVIGDDYQNIYQFRGTNNYYMINFDRIIPNVKTYFLKNNYRSSKNIVNLANTSISYNINKVDKIMVHIDKNINNIKPELIINQTEYNSYCFIINKIKDYISNYNYQDICILSRNCYPLKMMETELTKHDIPHIALITDKNSDDTKKLIEPGKVVLTTIHKSKGLEWSIVFIIGLSHQHFPEHLNNNIKNIEEERRLFYVAITRCKKHLHFISQPSEFPLSIFLKECINHIEIKNNTNKKLEDFLGGNDTETYTKKIYGVNELISLLNENDLEKLRNKNLIPNIFPEINIAYENKLTFTEDIKKNAFEPDLGEFCDRYITRNIIKNFNIDFIDIDTEQIIRDNIHSKDKMIIDLLTKDINNFNLEKPYIYPDIIIDKIINSYRKIKTNDYNNKDIYWISLCRNFRLERRRLVYRDIFNLIETNILNTINDNSLINRMDDYIKLYSKHKNISCKVLVRHEFKNNKKEKCFICGEIDMVDDDTIIDFKCSESDFKLEWLVQLLTYYFLLNNNSINKLCIINIMNGHEYLFIIPENYKTINKKNELIEYLEIKIKNDQQSNRNYPSINQNILNNNNIIQVKQSDVQFVLNTKENKTNNFMVLDTETSDLNGDVIQLAYIIIDENFKIIKTVNKFIKDRIPSKETILIHGITVEKLRKEGTEFNDVFKEFITDLKNIDYIVGHNIAFDLRIIINNLRKFEIKIISNGKINYNIFKNYEIKDTYTLSNKKLEILYNELFNKPIIGAHNALNDVLATFECYKYLLKI